MDDLIPFIYIAIGLICSLSVAIYAHLDPKNTLGKIDEPADLLGLGFIMAGVAVFWPVFVIMFGLGWGGLKIARKVKP
jgi:hypothetical protein